MFELYKPTSNSGDILCGFTTGIAGLRQRRGGLLRAHSQLVMYVYCTNQMHNVYSSHTFIVLLLHVSVRCHVYHQQREQLYSLLETGYCYQDVKCGYISGYILNGNIF